MKVSIKVRKATKQDRDAYITAVELESLIDSVGAAMRSANLDYVAQGRPTPNMEAALDEFYTWAWERGAVRHG